MTGPALGGGLEIGPDGSIRVPVGERVDPAAGTLRWKWYTYRWDGSAFAQVGPAVDVPADLPSHLSVTANQATTGRLVTLTLTVHNGGPVGLNRLRVSLSAPRQLVVRFGTASVEPIPGGVCSPCGWAISIEAVPEGASVVGTFVIELPEGGQPTDLTVSVVGATVRTDDPDAGSSTTP